jgi:hypothetical protein
MTCNATASFETNTHSKKTIREGLQNVLYRVALWAWLALTFHSQAHQEEASFAALTLAL